MGVCRTFIGTSSGPKAAICRESKPNSGSASNNFLEVGYNFLDVGRAIRPARWYAGVRFSGVGLDSMAFLLRSARLLFNHCDKGRNIDAEPREQIAHRLADGGSLSFQCLHHCCWCHIVKIFEKG